MFNVIGCLGVSVGQADTIDMATLLVLRQIAIGNKKVQTMRNALSRLTTGQEYHVEYGGSGCTIRRL